MGQSVPFRRPAVLVVEDEPITRLSAMDMVETAGFEAVGVSTATEAFEVLKTRSDIRAVFVDIELPGSIDGLELVRIMEKRWPKVARLVTSAQPSIDADDLPGGVRFFGKPYPPLQIQAALRQLIGGSGRQSTPD